MTELTIGLLLLILILQVYFHLKPKPQKNSDELKQLSDLIQRAFERIETNFREDFRLNREESRLVGRDTREELARALADFKETFDRSMTSLNNLQRDKFKDLDDRQQTLLQSTEKRLEEIRITVDEKLQKTLNDRIGQSFRMVTEQLESVQKGLGETISLWFPLFPILTLQLETLIFDRKRPRFFKNLHAQLS